MGSMRKSRLSHYKQDRLTEHFIAGTTARTAARFCGLHRNTAAYYFLRLREIIAYELEAEIKAMFGGEIEVDESYFGACIWFIKKGWKGLHQDYPRCFRGYFDPDHQAQGCAGQHRIFRLLERLQRAGCVGFPPLPPQPF